MVEERGDGLVEDAEGGGSFIINSIQFKYVLFRDTVIETEGCRVYKGDSLLR
jgi:hypothetical protein